MINITKNKPASGIPIPFNPKNNRQNSKQLNKQKILYAVFKQY